MSGTINTRRLIANKDLSIFLTGVQTAKIKERSFSSKAISSISLLLELVEKPLIHSALIIRRKELSNMSRIINLGSL